MDSDTCWTYGMTTVALGVPGSEAGLWAGWVCQFLLTKPVGYPLLLKVLDDVLLLIIPVRDRHADPVCSSEKRAGHCDLVH